MWKDPRLEYLNLMKQDDFNELSREELNNIWKPEVEFSHVNDGKIKVFGVQAHIRINGSMLPNDHNDINMGKI